MNLEDLISNRTVISISPFYHEKVCSGVTWRINFIVKFLKSKTHTLFVFMRSGYKHSVKSSPEIFFGSKNKYLHLFDPVLVLRMAQILLTKKNSIIYCHTFLSGFYCIFFKIFFRKSFVFDNHNVEFDRFKSYNRALSLLVFIFEFCLVKLSSLTILSSIDDKNRISLLYGVTNTCVKENEFEKNIQIHNFCRIDILKKLGLPIHKKMILFYGSFDYFPNKEALHFIGTAIAPFLDNEKYCIVIAGKNSDTFSGEYKYLKCLGFVEDLISLIHSADLIIAPIFSGGGVKIKVLEALSAGKDVLTTSEGSRGISYRGGQLLLSNKESYLRDLINYFSMTP